MLTRKDSFHTGSGEDGNGRRRAGIGDIETSIFTEVRVRKLTRPNICAALATVTTAFLRARVLLWVRTVLRIVIPRVPVLGITQPLPINPVIVLNGFHTK